MVFASSYSRIENDTQLLLDSVPQTVDPSVQRNRSMSSPPRPSFRPSTRGRAVSDPYYKSWQTIDDDDDANDLLEEDDTDLLDRPALHRKKSSGLGLFKQNVLKAVGIKT